MLDNTDEQAIALSGNTLSITGNASTVDLSQFLDDTDTNLTEAEVDAFVANNGFLTSFTEVDGDTTNELNDSLSLSGNTLELVDPGGTLSVDLSPFLDDTDTDEQALSLTGNTLSLVNGGSVDLSQYLDNVDTTVDNQALSIAGTTLSLTSDDGTDTIDLSFLLDDTDTTIADDQTLALSGNTLTLGNGDNPDSVIDLTPFLDDTTIADDQTLTWTAGTTTLEIADGNTVNLSSLLDNTDEQAIACLLYTSPSPRDRG